MLRNNSDVLENASLYAQSHPALYLYILRDGLDGRDPEDMMHIGLQAMKEVPSGHPDRSRISLLTADYATEVQKPEIAEASSSVSPAACGSAP